MDYQNHYAAAAEVPAAMAAASERAAFLKRVYGILFLGVLGFAATLWATANVPVANEMAMGLGRLIYGQRLGFLIYLGLFMGGSFLVQSLAHKKPVNAIAFAGWVVLLGFLIAPIVLLISAVHGPSIISQASTLTAAVFCGLTLIVFHTGKDFSFLRGALTLGFWALLVVSVIGWLTGFSFGLWMSAAVIVLFAGSILYNTSEILHRYPTTMAMSAAIVLFTDVVILFKHLLLLLARSRE
jgi:FtsH-binding integral membrane protein